MITSGQDEPAPRGVMRDTAVVFTGALLLFLTTAVEFQPRPTDISALRVLDGEVPYRDFWTMYAPGSFVTVAAAFAVFGRELIVSTLLGMLTSAAAAAVAYRVCRVAAGRTAGLLVAGLIAAAFYGTSYHDGLTSYPPAFLLILLAVGRLAANADRDEWRRAVLPGLLLGAAALYKHDVAGYAAIACGAGLLVARTGGRAGPAWLPALVLGATAAAVPAAAIAWLVALGAGSDMWHDLVVFPLGDFKHVRGQYFPLVPQLRPTVLETAQELRLWAICNLPALAAVAGVVSLRRGWRALDPGKRFLVGCAAVAFVLHWMAAHVQLNTNAISLAWWGTLLGAIGLAPGESSSRARIRQAAALAVTGWAIAFMALPVYQFAANGLPGGAPVGLPGLAGVRIQPEAVARWQAMADAMADAAPPDAPLLFVSARNDIVVFARLVPFWLTPRRPATRHHELHPGITDTEAVQRRMLADIARQPPPVVVREHRFDDATLEPVKARFLEHVPVGSTLLDDWIAARYAPGARFGPYEVMRRLPPD